MALSEDQIDEVIQHIRSKVSNGCPLCGQRNWGIEPNVLYMGVMDTEYKQPVEGSAIPLIMVTCNDCFFSYHLPAVRLGVL